VNRQTQRVAKAIASAQFRRNYFGELGCEVVLVSLVWEQFVSEAEAAIAAMPEPALSVREARAVSIVDQKRKTIYDRWRSLGLGARATNYLINAGLTNISEASRAVNRLGDGECFNSPNFGPKAMAEIRALLGRIPLRTARTKQPNVGEGANVTETVTLRSGAKILFVLDRDRVLSTVGASIPSRSSLKNCRFFLKDGPSIEIVLCLGLLNTKTGRASRLSTDESYALESVLSDKFGGTIFSILVEPTPDWRIKALVAIPGSN
jgi:hypothetical protein